MERELPPYEVEEARTIATLGADLTIMAAYPCGHSRELYSLSLRRQIGAGVTIAKVRLELRCHKCQARMPQIRIYKAAIPSGGRPPPYRT